MKYLNATNLSYFLSKLVKKSETANTGWVQITSGTTVPANSMLRFMLYESNSATITLIKQIDVYPAYYNGTVGVLLRHPQYDAYQQRRINISNYRVTFSGSDVHVLAKPIIAT